MKGPWKSSANADLGHCRNEVIFPVLVLACRMHINILLFCFPLLYRCIYKLVSCSFLSSEPEELLFIPPPQTDKCPADYQPTTHSRICQFICFRGLSKLSPVVIHQVTPQGQGDQTLDFFQSLPELLVRTELEQMWK